MIPHENLSWFPLKTKRSGTLDLHSRPRTSCSAPMRMRAELLQALALFALLPLPKPASAGNGLYDPLSKISDGLCVYYYCPCYPLSPRVANVSVTYKYSLLANIHSINKITYASSLLHTHLVAGGTQPGTRSTYSPKLSYFFNISSKPED